MQDLRRDYASRSLNEADTLPDPIEQFKVWFDEALKSQVIDANAMSLATASRDGEPSVRTVLLKGVDDTGLLFFTHYTSPKGQDLAQNPRAALLFYWAELERQVRITGPVGRIARAESEAYFATRPVDSRWAAWAARQSSQLPDRKTLEQHFAAIKQRYADGSVPCPPDWGGYRLTPERFEFWQGRPGRLHDRILYTRQDDGGWARSRLAP
jgi:pyridoxamine 5'-phosphate oxidase